ncbi:hydroxymethylglutaryl-CoA lyase [Eubacterium sp.]|uniref:hydroxymethylglutaryl-CoA lyase n=1 Tax=Eubacterium sp. TaxID=142586 RepID=UPI002FC9BB06
MEGTKIDVIEVGPRDGFQNQKAYIPLEVKIDIIERLIGCGVKHIQITSFVSPKVIPQMKDAGEVCRRVLEKHGDESLDLYALIPNVRGARNAWDAGLRKVNNVISLSKSHNKANINRTHDESFGELATIREMLPEMEVVLDAATAFGCPFEGKYAETGPLVDFLGRAYDLGVRTFNLCDTVGVADPAQVRRVVAAVQSAYRDARLEIHIHDTRAMGLVNSLAAIEAGVDGVQGALGGLGGCPFAPGASGNTATEDLVYMLDQMGYQTGIHAKSLIQAARYEQERIGEGNYSGHLMGLPDVSTCKI